MLRLFIKSIMINQFLTKYLFIQKGQKNILIKSKVANKKQIIVNGSPRCDYAFKLRKIKPKEKIIVFYLIEYDRNKNFFS